MPTAQSSWFLSQVVKVQTTFKDEADKVFDPAGTRFRIKTAKGVYLEPTAIKVSTGVYYIEVALTAKGTWFYRAEALNEEGEVIAVDEGPIEVRRSQFP